MGVLFEIALGVSLIVLCGGFVNYINTRRGQQHKERLAELSHGENGSDRLSEIERRLTDVQDIMLALNEKMDRLEMDRLEMGAKDKEREREL